MSVRTPSLKLGGIVVFLMGLGLVALDAAAVSRQQADAFARKIDVIEKQGSRPRRPAAPPQRTPVSEAEINSWFAYRSGDVLPDGLTQPSLTIVGNGAVTGNATVDLDAVARSRTSARGFDLWNLVGGRVPVTMGGIIRAIDKRSGEVPAVPSGHLAMGGPRSVVRGDATRTAIPRRVGGETKK